MQNINVRFNASSNFSKVKADIDALKASSASLSAVFQKGAYANPPELVNTDKWRAASRAVHEASNTFRDAASSSGLWTTQQIRATSEAERYTKALQKQKLTLTDMRRNMGLMKRAYEDQLRLQRMTAQYWGTDSSGRAITDIAIPTRVPRDLDTVAQKLYYNGQMAKSASTQFINMGKNAQWAGRQLTVGFTYPAVLFGAAAGAMAYSVDKELTRIAKVYDTVADAGSASASQQMAAQKELDKLREESLATAEAAARDYGAAMKDTLGISADLAATGLTGAALQKSTSEVVRIATLGEMDYQTALESTIALQATFKMSTDEVTESFNYMNAVENATSLQLKDFAAAIPIAANPIKAFGGDIKELGILLTAMRERGIGAVEGANAIKASMQRLARPSKQIQGEFAALTGGLDIKEIVRDSDSLSDIFVKLGKITEDMSRADKREIFGGLFGSYQVSRMMAMTEGMNDLAEGVGQVSDAYRISGQSAKQWEKDAAREVGQWQESASGKFKRAVETFKAELRKIGEPFLAIANVAIGAFTKVAEFFNGMADWQKKAILMAAGLAAIAGPIVMLGGLAFNLGGQFVKGIGTAMSAIGRLRGAVGLMTAEEEAAKLAGEAQNRAMMEQESTTTSLTREIEVLTAAYREATQAAKEFALGQGVTPETSPTSRTGKPSFASTLSPQEKSYFDRTSRHGSKGFRSNAARLDEARNAMAHDYMRSLNLAARDASDIEKKAAAEARIRDRMQKSVNLTNLAMASMAASTLMMTLPLGETTSNIGKWLMIGTVVVPAVATLVKYSWAASKAAWSTASGWLATARNATAAAMATARQAGMGGIAAGWKGALAGLGTIMGPAGWIATGTAVVGAGLFKWYQHTKSTREEQENLAKAQQRGMAAVIDSTKEWADATGTAWKNYKMYNIEGSKDKDNKRQMAYEQKVEEFKAQTVTVGSGDNQQEVKVVDQFKDMTPEEQDWAAVKMASEAVYNLGMNAKEAEDHLSAFFRATGLSVTEAGNRAGNALYKVSTKAKNIDWRKILFQGLDTANLTDNPELRKGIFDDLGGLMAQAVGSAKNTKERQRIFDEVREQFEDQWSDVAQEVSNHLGSEENIFSMLLRAQTGQVSDEQLEALRKKAEEIASILTMEGIRKAQIDGGVRETLLGLIGGDINTTDFSILYRALESIDEKSEAIMSNEKGLFGAAARSWGMEEGEYAMGNFFDSAEARISILDEKLLQSEFVKEDGALARAIRLWTQPVGESPLARLFQKPEDVDGELYGELFNEIQMFVNRGGIELDKLSDSQRHMLNMWSRMGHIDLSKLKKELRDVKKGVDDVPDSKNISLSITRSDIPGIINTAMSNVQQQMADSYMENFNKGWDNTMAGIESRHEAAQNKLQRQQEDAQDAFNKRWEARKEAVEKAYEQRIKSNERVIKAEEEADERRARLFEKEKARLQRLAEMQNKNIDYNTALNEGRLDDAAKIVNTTHADDLSAQMDAEQKAAEKRSEARIEALEKKNDRLAKQRDKEIKELEKMEERMRKHLQRTQQARADALRREQQDYMKAMEERRSTATKLEEHKLELFKAFVPRNKAELDRWIKQLGYAYGDFGGNVLKGGKKWSETIRDQLHDETVRAGIKVANDKVWDETGKEMANKLLRGFGFKGLSDFRKFVKTGEMPKKKVGTGANSGANAIRRHEGGVVDSGRGSRKGVAPTYKGLHRSEQMVLAQKGEYIVNKDASARHRNILESINSGNYDKYGNRIPRTGGAIDFMAGAETRTAPGGMAALASGVVANMFKQGATKAFNNAHAVGKKKEARNERRLARQSNFGGNRSYNLGPVKPWVAEAAHYLGNKHGIGTIGGWRAGARDMNGHPAGRALDFMTSSFAQGDALLKDIVKLRGPLEAEYAIWKQRIYGGSGSWTSGRLMSDRGSPTQNHMDHIHLNFLPTGKTGDLPSLSKGLGFGKSKRSGKYWRASDPGKGWTNSHDYKNGWRSPVYAIGPGYVRTAQLPPTAGSGQHPNARPRGYGSYGVVSYLTTDDGQRVMYAHLYPGSQVSGRVEGGQRIALSASTGNSSGNHTHFEVNGSGTHGDARGRFAAMGIPLRTGGTIKYDNTPATLHKGETVLTAPLTQKFKENVASGGGDEYNVTIDLRGAYIKEDVDIERAVNAAIDKRENKLGRRRVVK